MALTDLKIRSLHPSEKITRHTDDRGLYVEVHPSGSKLWRYKYRYAGKQKRLALGRYPDVGLAEARSRRDEARKKVEAGIDPLLERKREKLVARFSAANTFGEIAKEYIDKRVAEGQSEATTQKANWLLDQVKCPATRQRAQPWATWPRASNATRNWNRSWLAASASSGSDTIRAGGWARSSLSPTASTLAEEGG